MHTALIYGALGVAGAGAVGAGVYLATREPPAPAAPPKAAGVDFAENAALDALAIQDYAISKLTFGFWKPHEAAMLYAALDPDGLGYDYATRYQGAANAEDGGAVPQAAEQTTDAVRSWVKLVGLAAAVLVVLWLISYGWLLIK